MLEYISFVVCFVYCVIDNWMPVATHRHEPSERKCAKSRPLLKLHAVH
jgi:hypothetical protein